METKLKERQELTKRWARGKNVKFPEYPIPVITLIKEFLCEYWNTPRLEKRGQR